MNLDFVQNPWFTLSGWIIGAISLAAAFYYGVKGKAKKELSYLFVKSERLISNGEKKVPKLHLLFGDKEINDITINSLHYSINFNEKNERGQYRVVITNKSGVPVGILDKYYVSVELQ